MWVIWLFIKDEKDENAPECKLLKNIESSDIKVFSLYIIKLKDAIAPFKF
jgi:hypothetical protein